MNETDFRLISFSICPYVQRPRIVMLEKQIPHTIEYIDLQAPPIWFHEISPLEKVPVLVMDGQALFESNPICEYLDEITPGSLYPADPFRKAQHRAWIEFGNDVLNQLQVLVSARDEKVHKRAGALLEERWDILEEVLDDGPFFADHVFGMVDAVFAPIFRITRELRHFTGLELIGEDVPKVAAWAGSLLQQPSVKAAVPDCYREEYGASIRRLGGVICQNFS